MRGTSTALNSAESSARQALDGALASGGPLRETLALAMPDAALIHYADGHLSCSVPGETILVLRYRGTYTASTLAVGTKPMFPRFSLVLAFLLISACQTTPETPAPLAEALPADVLSVETPLAETPLAEMLSVPTSSPGPPAAQIPTPASWVALDTSELNAAIDAAISADADWPSSALMATLQLIGGYVDSRIVVIEEEKNRGENPDSTTVVYIRDGFLGDSVRGDWHELLYWRLSDGTWRVSEARYAWRCWRGENVEDYRVEPCP